MDRCWFLTWTTYGTWLPGDERGFVSELRDTDWHKYLPNQPRTEYPTHTPALNRFAQTTLKGHPVWLSANHAAIILSQFQETATYRGWLLFAVAIMSNHIHVVVGVPGDPDPSDILGDFKEYASRALNRHFGKRLPGKWWTQSGSMRKKPDERSQCSTIAYVRDQFRPLVVWLNETGLRATFGELIARQLLSPESASTEASGNREVAGDEASNDPSHA